MDHFPVTDPLIQLRNLSEDTLYPLPRCALEEPSHGRGIFSPSRSRSTRTTRHRYRRRIVHPRDDQISPLPLLSPSSGPPQHYTPYNLPVWVPIYPPPSIPLHGRRGHSLYTLICDRFSTGSDYISFRQLPRVHTTHPHPCAQALPTAE